MRTFTAYQLAVTFYRTTPELELKGELREQLQRAGSSIALNLNEGSAKSSRKDRLRFYEIAFGSIRECQAIFDLLGMEPNHPSALALDRLAACTFRLCESLRPRKTG